MMMWMMMMMMMSVHVSDRWSRRAGWSAVVDGRCDGGGGSGPCVERDS